MHSLDPDQIVQCLVHTECMAGSVTGGMQVGCSGGASASVSPTPPHTPSTHPPLPPIPSATLPTHTPYLDSPPSQQQQQPACLRAQVRDAPSSLEETTALSGERGREAHSAYAPTQAVT